MKRMLVTAVSVAAAAAAFAAPANAQTSTIGTPAVKVACSKPLVECARDLALWATDPANIVNLAFDAVVLAGETFDDVCDATFGTCNVTP